MKKKKKNSNCCKSVKIYSKSYCVLNNIFYSDPLSSIQSLVYFHTFEHTKIDEKLLLFQNDSSIFPQKPPFFSNHHKCLTQKHESIQRGCAAPVVKVVRYVWAGQVSTGLHGRPFFPGMEKFRTKKCFIPAACKVTDGSDPLRFFQRKITINVFREIFLVRGGCFGKKIQNSSTFSKPVMNNSTGRFGNIKRKDNYLTLGLIIARAGIDCCILSRTRPRHSSLRRGASRRGVGEIVRERMRRTCDYRMTIDRDEDLCCFEGGKLLKINSQGRAFVVDFTGCWVCTDKHGNFVGSRVAELYFWIWNLIVNREN